MPILMSIKTDSKRQINFMSVFLAAECFTSYPTRTSLRFDDVSASSVHDNQSADTMLSSTSISSTWASVMPNVSRSLSTTAASYTT